MQCKRPRHLWLGRILEMDGYRKGIGQSNGCGRNKSLQLLSQAMSDSAMFLSPVFLRLVIRRRN
jgi:hypothetical protein